VKSVVDPSSSSWQVEIKGVDVYDPTTGEIRSHSTDDIACWFIDTDYDGESFFVRHAVKVINHFDDEVLKVYPDEIGIVSIPSAAC
jgi:hypothetical protein